MNISVISCVSVVFFLNDMTSGYGRHSVSTGYRPMGLRGGVRCARRRLSGDELPENSTVYVYGDEELSEDEIRNEDIIELLTRNRYSRGTRSEEDSMITCVEILAKEGDTLTNIALKYSCKVADLKRLNKLINDQDFYGLKRIRVPVIRHGVLEEKIQMEDKESAFNDPTKFCIESIESHLLDLEPAASLASSTQNSQGQQAQQLLLRYDQNIQNAVNSARLEPSNTEAFLRPPLGRQIGRTPSWRTVLLFFVMFCVIIPVVGGLYVILKHFLGY